jgi:hypothetical protein
MIDDCLNSEKITLHPGQYRFTGYLNFVLIWARRTPVASGGKGIQVNLVPPM